MGELSKSDQVTAQIKERFQAEAQQFFNATHGIIDISKGDDAITNLAAENFIPYSLMALKEDGFELDPAAEGQSLSDTAFHAFCYTIEDKAQRNYVIENQDHYTHSLDKAIKNEIDKRRADIEDKKYPNLLHSIEYVIL